MPLPENWNLISPASLKIHILQIVFSIFKNERKTNSCSSLRYNKFERVDSQCDKARGQKSSQLQISSWNFLNKLTTQLSVHVETFSGEKASKHPYQQCIFSQFTLKLSQETTSCVEKAVPVCKSKPVTKCTTVSQIFNSLQQMQQMQQMQHQIHNGESNFQLNNSLQLNKTGIYHLNPGYMWCNFSRFLGRNVARHARMNAAWCTSRSEWNIRYQNFKDVVNFG